MNRSTLCIRENSRQRSFLIQKSTIEKVTLLMFSSSSSSSMASSLGRFSVTWCTFGEFFLKFGLRCPGSWQRKQSPFSMHFLHSSAISLPTLMMFTSMVSGSQVLVAVEKDW